VTGPIARSIGDAIGLGTTALTVWNLAKSPVMLVVVVGLVTLLYHATPNVRHPRLRVLSVGAVIAILTWLLSSAAFGLYVAHFASYNKTYGSLAGVIVFLLWLWITNLALLFGAEVDAERERSQELQAGMPAEEQLQLPPRDTRAVEKRQRKRVQRIRAGRRLRLRRQPGREPGLEHELEHELETEPRATRTGEES
jgi:membrane protein